MAATLYKPYVWLQTISASVSKVHFIVYLGANETLADIEEENIDYDDERGTLTLNYYVVEDDDADDGQHDVECVYEIGDPAFEDILVIVTDTDSRKRRGTVQQSEGDTSGDD